MQLDYVVANSIISKLLISNGTGNWRYTADSSVGYTATITAKL